MPLVTGRDNGVLVANKVNAWKHVSPSAEEGPDEGGGGW